MPAYYQTRSEETGLIQHLSLDAAMEHARRDISIWKISFDASGGERIRLIRRTFTQKGTDHTTELWIYEPMPNEQEIRKLLEPSSERR